MRMDHSWWEHCSLWSALSDGWTLSPASWLVMEISQTDFLAQQWCHQWKLIHLCVVLSYTSKVSWDGAHWCSSEFMAVVHSSSHWHYGDCSADASDSKKVFIHSSTFSPNWFMCKPAGLFVLFCLHIWPQCSILTLSVHGGSLIF